MNPEIDPNLNENRELDELRQRVAELEQTEAERLRRELDAASRQRKRDFQIILFLAVSPLLLEAFFFVLNRSYMSKLFQDPNLPYGLVIQAAVIILALISFFTMRSSLSVLRSGRVILGWVMGLLVSVLFIIPAWMLVFLAPAMLILIRSAMLD